ncbi:MAG: AAA family ATPase [Tannerella sp.]|nr:AAA family ATPase [Tannerella sp.]
METQIIGRKKEQKRLQDLYGSGRAEFVAIYGRRRVGKTFLVRQLFGSELVFDLAGLANANTTEQLINFTIALNHAGNKQFKTPKNWLFAFEQLRTVIENSQKKRKVVFIDEISWLDTARSGFLTALGGIPYYLSKIETGLSVAQNIDNLFFMQSSELKNEFQNLYASLFKNYADYIKIVEALSTKAKGLTRKEIEEIAQLSSGGRLTTALKNLEYCGFIRAYHLFGKKKYEQIYQLLDSYTLFYFKYLAKNENNDEYFWTNSLNTPQHNAWAGYAFEILTLQHVAEIKKALGISGVQTTISAWRSEKSVPAAQIDLVIDRKDGIIDICEVKFSKNQFSIDREYDKKLRNKISAFISENNTRKAIHLLMLTTYGIAKNKYYSAVQKEVILDDLFA